MLTTRKPWELQPDAIILWRGDHYKVDFIAPGRPSLGWTTLHCKSMRDGLVTILMIESDEDVNTVVARDYTAQRNQANRRDNSWASRRVRGSSR